MKILVTGGSGFLGSHIVEQLSEQGHEVVALVRKSSNRKFLEKQRGVSFAFGAIEDAAAVEKAAEGVEAIVHSAGLVKARSPEEFRATNVKGTENVIAAAKLRGPELKRLVFVSSLAAVGPSLDGTPVPSSKSPTPVTHYGRSKLEAERAVLAAKDEIPVTVIRPPMIYGPRDNETFAFFQSVDTRVLPFIGDPKKKLSVVFGADAASACIRAIFADVPSGRCYFVEDGRVYEIPEMLAELERILGKRALLRFQLPNFVLTAAAIASETYGRARNQAVMLTRDKLNELNAPHWVCDASDTRAELGWKPTVDWAEGARRAAEWYRTEGWL